MVNQNNPEKVFDINSQSSKDNKPKKKKKKRMKDKRIWLARDKEIIELNTNIIESLEEKNLHVERNRDHNNESGEWVKQTTSYKKFKASREEKNQKGFNESRKSKQKKGRKKEEKEMKVEELMEVEDFMTIKEDRKKKNNKIPSNFNKELNVKNQKKNENIKEEKKDRNQLNTKKNQTKNQKNQQHDKNQEKQIKNPTNHKNQQSATNQKNQEKQTKNLMNHKNQQHAKNQKNQKNQRQQKKYNEKSVKQKFNETLRIYEEYKDKEELSIGLKNGTFLKGTLRMNSKYPNDAYVTIQGLSKDIYINGIRNRNRALHGQVVILKLEDVRYWKKYDKNRIDLSTAKLYESMEHLHLQDDTNENADEDDFVDGKNDFEWFEQEEEEGVKEEKLNNSCKNLLDPWFNNSIQTSLWQAEPFHHTVNQNSINSSMDLEEKNDSKDEEERLKQFEWLEKMIERLKKQPSGKVVGIESSNSIQLIGALTSWRKSQIPKDIENESEEWLCFHPSDECYPRMKIPKSQVTILYQEEKKNEFQSKNIKKMIYLCCLDEWKEEWNYPNGKFLCILGEKGAIQTETNALLRMNQIPHEDTFSTEVLNSLKTFLNQSQTNLEWEIPEKEYQTRRDLRTKRIFSIDPTNARDLDDALHCTYLKNEKCYEIGVHIADVSYFVREHTAVDLEAMKRATTVYLVHKVLPMLPRLLCEQLCSLNPHVDRLAFSIIWKMKEDGTLINEKPWIGRTIIRSCCKLDYQTAQYMIDRILVPSQKIILTKWWEKERRPHDGHTEQEIIQDVQNLYHISSARRKIRYDNGALSLGRMKLQFRLNKQGNPIQVNAYPILQSNHLVEEYMLLANYLISQHLLACVSDLALLRCHPFPEERGLNKMVKIGKKFGIHICIETSQTLHDSLNSIPSQNMYTKKESQLITEILQLMGTHPMKPAEYFCAGLKDSTYWKHYALNIPSYTHFTSPIRRYADIIVHRLVESTLELESSNHLTPNLLKNTRNKDEIQQIAEQCNQMKMKSKAAQEACDRVFLYVYIQSQKSKILNGIVLSLGKSSFTLYFPKYGLESRIFLLQMKEKITSQWNEETNSLILFQTNLTDPKKKKKKENSWKELRIEVLTKLAVEISVKKSTPLKLTYKILYEISSLKEFSLE